SHGTVHLARRVALEDGTYFERIVVFNYGSTRASFPLRVEVAADFADIFEVRGSSRPKRGELLPPEIRPSSLRLSYEGLDRRTRTTELAFSEPPTSIEAGEVTYDLALEPHSQFCL